LHGDFKKKVVEFVAKRCEAKPSTGPNKHDPAVYQSRSKQRADANAAISPFA
jgi:hypothetical protein